MTAVEWDVAVVGGGIVGLATVLALGDADPSLRVGIVEKERQPATHQTGHNSGVVHSGVYYRPGTLKAHMCVAGAARMIEFCRAHAIPHRRVGKVIVAVTEEEMPALRELLRRGRANGVPGLAMLDRSGLQRVEPQVAGVAALHIPGVAVVDYRRVAAAMAGDARRRGVEIRTSWPVTGAVPVPGGVELESPRGPVSAATVVNCAGLYADVVARKLGAQTPVQIVPFRGEYHNLRPDQAQRIGGLVYPVPDVRFPFLGVHLTPTPDGRVEAGPNAVLAFAREGYRWRTVHVAELLATLRYEGLRRLAARHWRTGLGEMRRSLSRRAFAAATARLLPGVRRRHLTGGGSGVRAQAVRPDGTLEDDFVLTVSGAAVHVLNAPSPAATASLVIGEHIAGAVLSGLGGDVG